MTCKNPSYTELDDSGRNMGFTQKIPCGKCGPCKEKKMSSGFKCFRPLDIEQCRDACFYAKRCCFEENKPPPLGMEKKMSEGTPDKCECKAYVCCEEVQHEGAGQWICLTHNLSAGTHFTCGSFIGHPCVKEKPVEDGEELIEEELIEMDGEQLKGLRRDLYNATKKIRSLEEKVDWGKRVVEELCVQRDEADKRTEKAQAERDDLKAQLTRVVPAAKQALFDFAPKYGGKSTGASFSREEYRIAEEALSSIPDTGQVLMGEKKIEKELSAEEALWKIAHMVETIDFPPLFVQVVSGVKSIQAENERLRKVVQAGFGVVDGLVWTHEQKQWVEMAQDALEAKS